MATVQIQHIEEPFPSKIRRKSFNAFYHTEAFCKVSDKNARLVYKKLQLSQAKKAFGLKYMGILEKDSAAPDDLETCMRDSHNQIGTIRKDIRHLDVKKASIKARLRERLDRKNGMRMASSASFEEPSIQVNNRIETTTVAVTGDVAKSASATFGVSDDGFTANNDDAGEDLSSNNDKKSAPIPTAPTGRDIMVTSSESQEERLQDEFVVLQKASRPDNSEDINTID